MPKIKILLFAFLLSILLHAVFFFVFRFYVTAQLVPYVLIWPEVLDRNYTSVKAPEDTRAINNIPFIRGLDVNKEFFISSLEKPDLKIKEQRAKKISLFLDDLQEERHLKNNFAPLYLWKKPESMQSQEKEKISYRAFVSPYGKVVFSFPEKLSVSSQDNVSSQEYLRQASMFLEDKFFWTKLDTVVR